MTTYTFYPHDDYTIETMHQTGNMTLSTAENDSISIYPQSTGTTLVLNFLNNFTNDTYVVDVLDSDKISYSVNTGGIKWKITNDENITPDFTLIRYISGGKVDYEYSTGDTQSN